MGYSSRRSELRGSSALPQIDIDSVLSCIKQGAISARNEAEVRSRVSKCIEDYVLKPLGITQYLHQEYTLVSGARVDALYGHVVIEYKAPGKLSSAHDIARAKEQVASYIASMGRTGEEWGKYLGVIVSDRVAFVRYDARQGAWTLRGPYDITREVVVKLVEALRGLRRKPLSVDNLLEDFGPQSELARKAIAALYRKLASSNNPRTRMLFDDWMRLFKQATGYSSERLRELPKLALEYGIPGKVDLDALMFSIQTYYALVMKLIAAEVACIYGEGKFYKSYIAELEDAYARGGASALRKSLEELESGGIFEMLGYVNFLEGDYFSWYLEEVDERLAEILAEIAGKLLDYVLTTPQLEPERARDLLKKLYQRLVPREVRHRLGEYYTPDWLADLLLNEAGLSVEELEKVGEKDLLGPLKIRFLDPACGSGTFLVKYVSRLREYAREHHLEDVLVSYLLENVVGYDLNPLAVLAARTNYLLMIADLPKRGRVEIPVYLADSLMVERKTTLTGDTYVLKTVAGEFQFPVSVVERGLLSRALSELVGALRSKYDVEEFRERLRQALGERCLSKSEIDALAELYRKFLELEEENKDGVWISIIRNAFAPVLRGKFDYVVGNPPWVGWENLPSEYREMSRGLWERYGVVGRGAGFKRDLAMLFLARCFDLYLKPSGKLAFLVPFTVFKTRAGSGFRKFLATRARVRAIHDLVTLYPFEGAVNRTSAIVLEKVCELSEAASPSKCPGLSAALSENREMRHVVWISRARKPISTDVQLKDVVEATERHQLVMTPIVEGDPSSSWMQVTRDLLPYIKRVIASSPRYAAHAGVLTGLNQVYYVQVRERLPGGKLLITNLPEPGQKRAVKSVEAVVESDLVYPLIRGRDVRKWHVRYEGRYIVVPHDPRSGRPLSERDLKIKYPGAYSYLSQFKESLARRNIKPFLSIMERARRSRSQAERDAALRELEDSFYVLDNVGPYTFSPYKVVWKRISGAITGKATSFACAVVEPASVELAGAKAFIPDDGIVLVGTSSSSEAYYLAGVLNSTIVRAVVASYTYELRQETHITDFINIPRFDRDSSVHSKISELSRRAHEIAKCIHADVKPSYCADIADPEAELRGVEEELDRAVAELYEIPGEALEGFRRLLDVLAGRGELEGSGEPELSKNDSRSPPLAPPQ